MKSFKGYLQEKAPAWTQSLSTMIFDLPRAGLVDLKIPLSPSIFSRVWPEPIRSTVFHLTDFEGVHKLKKMQGKKRSISAFYNMEPYIISSGIRTHGGYVVELEGDVLVAGPDDISSQPDKSGRRWLSWSTLIREMDGGSKLKGMENDLFRLLVKILIKNGEDVDAGSLDNIIGLQWSGLGKKHGGKTKSIIIKDYIDGMEQIIKKNAKGLRSVFTDYTNDREPTLDPDSGDVAMWDELVVNNFTIEKIHVAGGGTGPDFGDDDIKDRHSKILSKLKLPFQLWDDVGDMADYIARTVRKEK